MEINVATGFPGGIFIPIHSDARLVSLPVQRPMPCVVGATSEG